MNCYRCRCLRRVQDVEGDVQDVESTSFYIVRLLTVLVALAQLVVAGALHYCYLQPIEARVRQA